jgi:hypothetical protein
MVVSSHAGRIRPLAVPFFSTQEKFPEICSMIRKIRLRFPKSGRISPIVQQVPASFRLVRQRAGAIVQPCPTAAKYLSFALLDYQINDRFVVLPQTRETCDQVVSAIAHQRNMRNHIIKIAIVSMALVGEPLANGDPEFKANDGIYVVVNHVPKECKVKEVPFKVRG